MLYGSLSQSVLALWFFPADTVPRLVITILAASLFFSVAALWCGAGLRKRQRSRLNALVVFLWLHIAWSVGQSVWLYVDHFFLSPTPDSSSPEFLESLERSARYRLGTMVFGSIKVVLESAVLLWLIGQLSTSMIRDVFED